MNSSAAAEALIACRRVASETLITCCRAVSEAELEKLSTEIFTGLASLQALVMKTRSKEEAATQPNAREGNWART